MLFNYSKQLGIAVSVLLHRTGAPSLV